MSTRYELGLSVFEQRNEVQTAGFVRHFRVKSTVPVLPSVSCSSNSIYFVFKSLNLGVDGRIILEWIVRKQDGKVWTGCI
jgi:hypothetical protein